MTRSRVGVVMGGMSAEREVSLSSGAAVAKALRALGHDVVEIVLDQDTNPLDALTRTPLDAAFLALHGRFGEDGCIQGLLELMGVPYTGSGVLASALAMDKLKSKELFRLFNVPTPPYYVVRATAGPGELRELHGSFGFPAIVKPRREGSSIGVSMVGSLAELESAVEQAFEYDNSVLVERFISGREVHVGLLEGRVLGAIEVTPKSGIYDFAAKYTPGMTEYHMPARLPGTRYRGILNLAERAAEALGVVSAARVDLLVTEGQNEYVLEVNSLPGMTPTSLLPKIARSAGYEFEELCAAILEKARLFTGAGTGAATREQGAEPALEEASFELDEVVVAHRSAPALGARNAG